MGLSEWHVTYPMSESSIYWNHHFTCVAQVYLRRFRFFLLSLKQVSQRQRLATWMTLTFSISKRTKQKRCDVSCQAPRSAACAQRQACLPSELAGRWPQRRISWRLLTRSSSPTPSSAPPRDTWPTTESVWVRGCESFQFDFFFLSQAEN